MIYLDYAATTPVDPRVVEKMLNFMGPESCYANPASRSHMLGWQAEAAVEGARKNLAKLFSCDVRELVWTSGATESNNLAIKGALEALTLAGDTRRHIITSKTEHKAVLDCVAYLEAQGYSATYLSPDASGVITPEILAQAVREDTALVSVMHVNNETGVINPIKELAELCQARGVLMHVDCAQSAGKLPLDFSEIPLDFASFCAHKIYGPKGVGALFVRRGEHSKVLQQIHGGGHERGMRSGTLPTHQIVGFSEAMTFACDDMSAEQRRIEACRTRFLEQIKSCAFKVTGGDVNRVPGVLNLTFPKLDGQMLLTALPNLAISSGSACNSASMAPSHVLKAMGLSDEEALSALRFSFGRFTTEAQIDEAAADLTRALSALSA